MCSLIFEGKLVNIKDFVIICCDYLLVKLLSEWFIVMGNFLLFMYKVRVC